MWHGSHNVGCIKYVVMFVLYISYVELKAVNHWEADKALSRALFLHKRILFHVINSWLGLLAEQIRGQLSAKSLCLSNVPGPCTGYNYETLSRRECRLMKNIGRDSRWFRTKSPLVLHCCVPYYIGNSKRFHWRDKNLAFHTIRCHCMSID